MTVQACARRKVGAQLGCGIRANRSTDRVTTWWFVTDRRPGVDLALVESRTPLSADSLRATLGPGAVFLLMAHVPDSFDGRYFGTVRRRAVIGRLTPLWTW